LGVGQAHRPGACGVPSEAPTGGCAGGHTRRRRRLDPSATILPGTVLIGPVFIGPNSHVGPGAYLRGNVIVGARCRVGHGAEVKNSLLLDEVEAPHRPYIGDSVIGNRGHLAAGVVCSNLRLDRQAVCIRSPGGEIDTGLRKLGTLLGDEAEVGCNAVLNPGTLLGRRSLVMPAIAYGGQLPEGMIARVRQTVALVKRRT
jgi:NDP-sugar pyrophosphorylase family protein